MRENFQHFMESYNAVAVIQGPVWFKPNFKQGSLRENITIGYELFISLYPDIQFMKKKKSVENIR